jgi:hypothetical protein
MEGFQNFEKFKNSKKKFKKTGKNFKKGDKFSLGATVVSSSDL